VPELSRFFGIVIAMYDDDHPPPHFRARYGNQAAVVRISDGAVTGKLPARAVGLVLEWWSLHQAELANNWQLLAEGREPKKIGPLE
jgi:hypothetical protein